jgi:PTS system nitrogen regulatory IIA component
LNFGYMLKTLRVSARISLRGLARIVNVSPTYLSLVENEKQPPPSTAIIARIEDALGVPCGYLLSIAQCLRSDVNSFVHDKPAAIDFLNVAKENSMTSADFMDLTSFLSIYGREELTQLLRVGALKNNAPSGNSQDQVRKNLYIWPFMSEELVFDVVGVKGKEALLEDIVAQIAEKCHVQEPETMLRELLKRESVASTGIGSGVAIPHAYVEGLERMIVAFVRISEGLDFDAIDGEPVYMALLLAGPREAENLHLRLLARIAKLLNHNCLCENVLNASSAQQIISIFKSAEMSIP